MRVEFEYRRVEQSFFKKIGCLVKNPALAGEKECYPISLLNTERNYKIV